MSTIVLDKGFVFVSPVAATGTIVNNMERVQWGTVLKVNDLCENYVAGDTVFFRYENASLIQPFPKSELVYYLINEENILFKQNP